MSLTVKINQIGLDESEPTSIVIIKYKGDRKSITMAINVPWYPIILQARTAMQIVMHKYFKANL